jgi:iron complex transport system substrate-binding protein
MHRPHLPLLLTLLVIAAATVSACGSSDDDASTTATTAPGAAFPVTIDNQLGDVTVPDQPARVVALDFDSADAALALGVVPVGMSEVSWAPGKVLPWTRAALDGEQPELYSDADGAPLEKIAALRPDLILATNSYGLEDTYAKLSRIAPVVATEGDEGSDSWQTSTRRIGTALGKAAEADKLVETTEQAVRDARQANPELDGKTITLFNLYQGSATVITREDAAVKLLRQLGFVPNPKIDTMKSIQGRVEVTPERFELLDTDVLAGTTPTGNAAAELKDVPTFQRLDAVRRDAFVDLDLVTATSIAFPSALSVRWSLEKIVPKLATAAG